MVNILNQEFICTTSQNCKECDNNVFVVLKVTTYEYSHSIWPRCLSTTANLTVFWYSCILLCGEGHYRRPVSCPRTQYNDLA